MSNSIGKHKTLTSKIQPRHWRITDQAMENKLTSSLRRHKSLSAHSNRHHTMQFFDTFPQQLWFSGHVLFRIDHAFYFAAKLDCRPDGALAIAGVKGTPTFWWEFPDDIAVRLEPHTKLRALLPQVKIAAVDKRFDVTNRDQKIVARVLFSTFKADHNRGAVFLRTCSCLPVRGYARDYHSVCNFFEKNELDRVQLGLLEAYFDWSNSRPEPYRLKPRLELDPQQSALSALCATVQTFLRTARSNEPGIIEDLDTEFLHDYRVCIRSIRALLNQVNGVYPPEIETLLKESFFKLGKRTNRLRDLDVYLLERAGYQAMVPAALQGGLDTMFQDFEGQRKKERAGLVRYLRSQSYKAHMGELEQMLANACAADIDGKKRRNIGPIVSASLTRQLRKIRKASRQLNQDTSNKTIHLLRLRCKKLRYTLDFFSSLLYPTAAAQLADSLRRLQNTLGEFNDLSVQQAALMDYYHHVKNPDPDLGPAIGVVVGAMHHRQGKLRARIVKLFAEFNTAVSAGLIADLLGPLSDRPK